MASWALVHETADEGWKAAVARGSEQGADGLAQGPEAFVDGLSALIAQEKERLKASLAGDQVEAAGSRADVATHLDELTFEVSELRGRLESMQASLDALVDQSDDTGK